MPHLDVWRLVMFQQRFIRIYTLHLYFIFQEHDFIVPIYSKNDYQTNTNIIFYKVSLDGLFVSR